MVCNIGILSFIIVLLRKFLIKSKYSSIDVCSRFKVPWFIELRVMYQISQNLFQITRATHVDTYFLSYLTSHFSILNLFYSKHGISGIIYAMPNTLHKKSWKVVVKFIVLWEKKCFNYHILGNGRKENIS